MANDDPLRLRIMKALTALFETISTDSNSGYHHDLAGKVFRGRDLFGDSDPVPMISILEKPIPLDQTPPPEDAPISTGLWEIMVQGFCEDDKKNPTDPAYVLSADVIRCLALEKKRVPEGRAARGKAPPLLGVTASNGNAAVIDILIGSPVHRPPDGISGKAYFWLVISLKIAENLDDPWG